MSKRGSKSKEIKKEHSKHALNLTCFNFVAELMSTEGPRPFILKKALEPIVLRFEACVKSTSVTPWHNVNAKFLMLTTVESMRIFVAETQQFDVVEPMHVVVDV